METGEILCTGSVADLPSLIASCGFPGNAFFLAEQFPSYIINNAQRQNLLRFAWLGDVQNVQDYTSGRIFTRTYELRWEKESSGDCQVVYCGPEREISGLSKDEKESKNIKHYKQTIKDYYLFGERLEARQLARMGIDAVPENYNYYATVRIPRLLLYPIQAGARRVQLRVCEYLDETTGFIRLCRFQDLIDDAERKQGEAKA